MNRKTRRMIQNIVVPVSYTHLDVYKRQLLRRAYSLNDGIYKLQTKDIATLYEIWCFIEVSHIVKEHNTSRLPISAFCDQP